MKFQAKIFLRAAFLAAAFLISVSISAQDWMDDEDYGLVRKGFEFGLNFGVYQAKHDAATFYEGDGDYVLGSNDFNLYSIQNYIDDFNQQEIRMQNILGWNEPLEVWTYPIMRYDISMMFGLKGTYFFNDENAFVIGINSSFLKASGNYSLKNQTGLNDQFNSTLEFDVVANERRYISNLGYRTSLYITDYSTWIFGLGVTSTTCQIISNEFYVENEPFDLLVSTNPGTIGSPGISNPGVRKPSNTGFGFYGIVGLEGMFEQGGNLEANFRISRDRIKLGQAEDTGEFGSTGYDRVNWNFALYITWMIPPHIGDFVRASF